MGKDDEQQLHKAYWCHRYILITHFIRVCCYDLSMLYNARSNDQVFECLFIHGRMLGANKTDYFGSDESVSEVILASSSGGEPVLVFNAIFFPSCVIFCPSCVILKLSSEVFEFGKD
jgi:hypothetical protein